MTSVRNLDSHLSNFLCDLKCENQNSGTHRYTGFVCSAHTFPFNLMPTPKNHTVTRTEICCDLNYLENLPQDSRSRVKSME